MPLLTDLYLLGKKKGYDRALLLKEQRITHYIDAKPNGSFTITKAKEKKGDVHLVTNVGARPGVGSLRVNNFWDSCGFYKNIPDERNKAFWDNAEEILAGAGDKKTLAIIRKLRKRCYIPDLAETQGYFAIRVAGQLVISKRVVLDYLEKQLGAGGDTVCLLSGERCTPVRLHPGVAIDGFEHRTAPMVSFNARVFEYGNLSQGDNFPVSQRAANAYARMLEELGRDAIRLPVYKGGKLENKVAVIVWSSEDSPNAEKIRSILDGWEEPDWKFTRPKGNIHFLAMSMEKQRRPILAYDVIPEHRVIANLKQLREETVLFSQRGIKQRIHSLEQREKTGRLISPDMVVQFYRHALFRYPYPKTIKQSVVALFNQRVTTEDGLKLGFISRAFVQWVEFFLFAERGYA
jgi:hypothetical protein